MLNSIFQLVTANTYKCRSCDNSSTSESKDRSFTVYLNDPTDHGRLEEYISNSLATEVPEGYRCDRCRERNTTRKTPSFNRPPVLLLVLLNRIQSDGENARKIVDHVAIGEKLDLTEYSRNPNFRPLKYDLKAVIHHQHAEGKVNKKTGAVMFSVNSGHYKAVVQGPNSLWRELEDEVVKENAGLASAVNPPGQNWTPYLLLYKLVRPPALGNARNRPTGVVDSGLGDKRKRKDSIVDTGASKSRMQQSDGPASSPFIGSASGQRSPGSIMQARWRRDDDLRVQMLKRLHNSDSAAFLTTGQQKFQQEVIKPETRGKTARDRAKMLRRKSKIRLHKLDQEGGMPLIQDSNSSDRMSWNPTDDLKKGHGRSGDDEGPFIMPARGMSMSCFADHRAENFWPDSPDRMSWSPTLPADKRWDQANTTTLPRVAGTREVPLISDWDGLFGDQKALFLARKRLRRKPKYVFTPSDMDAPSATVVDPAADVPLDPKKVAALGRAGFRNPEGFYRRMVAGAADKSRHPAVGGERARGGRARRRPNGITLNRVNPNGVRLNGIKYPGYTPSWDKPNGVKPNRVKPNRGKLNRTKPNRSRGQPYPDVSRNEHKLRRGAWVGQSVPYGGRTTRASASAAASSPIATRLSASGQRINVNEQLDVNKHINMPGSAESPYDDLASIERKRDEARFQEFVNTAYSREDREKLLALLQ